jgi:hypothetical protein
VPQPIARRSIWFAIALASVIAASAQTPQREDSWKGPADIAATFQRVRELSGRFEIFSFMGPYDPKNLQSLCDERKAAERDALQYEADRVHEIERLPAGQRDLNGYLAALSTLAQVHAYSGDMANTTAVLENARAVVSTPEGRERWPGSVAAFEALIGISELRRGEIENCVMHPNAMRCIFPVTGTGRHEMPSGSQHAMAALTEALAARPDDLELRWLLNVVAMTLGKYPDGVPAAALLPPSRFQSAENPGAFTNVAAELGLGREGRAGGSVMDDFNGDGRLDIAMSSVDPCEPLHLYLQQPDGRFAESADSGLADQLGGINMVQTDYNNDGRVDLFVMRGGWEGPIRNSLLRNNGDGTFTDVTAKAGLIDVPHSTHSAAWADYDNDGNLDLFVGHERTTSRLYRNRGDGTFEDVTRKAGVGVQTFVKGAAWGDYDRDGYPDLYLSNFGEANVLFHNNGDGTFTDVTTKLGVTGPRMSFPTWFFDYDNDGWPDLFVADFVPSVAEMLKTYIGERPSAETLRLYHNVHGERFEDVTARMGLDRVTLTMGANYGDIDNDGWLDIYLGTGAPSFAALAPNLLFRNHDGQRFVDVTTATGTGHLGKGHAVAIGDVDGDGNEDIFVNVGGFVPADKYAKVLFKNPGHKNHWVGLKLTGVRTNRQAIGARVTVVAQDASGHERSIYRVVSSGGSFGASPLALHVGVGDAARVARVEVFWPVSRISQVVNDVPLDRQTTIVEPTAQNR